MVSCKVPDNLEVLLSYADSTEITDRLHAGIFLNGKKEKFWLDKITGANVFEVYARGLSIAGENDQSCWNWTSGTEHEFEPDILLSIQAQPSLALQAQAGLTLLGSNSPYELILCKLSFGSDVEVAEAVNILFLEVKNDFPIRMLTPRTSYKVSFFLKRKEDNNGYNQPVELKLDLPNQGPVTSNECLNSMPIDEWREIHVGEFITPYDHGSGVVKISMEQTGTQCIKKGLVVDKILIQPVMKGWRELSGENQWKDLLDPLNVDLSKFLTGYGERLDAIYDCMTKDEDSPMYTENLSFSEVGPDKGKAMNYQKYEVKKYIYAWVDVSSFAKLLLSTRSVWIGYVAVATDAEAKLLGRRDILVCWRGTQNIAEWERNVNFSPTHAQVIYPNVPKAEVHCGIYSIYTHPNREYDNKRARDQVVDEVKIWVNKYKDEEVSITITGYSLGAALATLNAADIVSNGYNTPEPNPENKKFLVTAIVFGSPKVGNIAFQTEFNKHVLERKLRLLRIENVKDVITQLPPGNYVKLGNDITFARTSASSSKYGKIRNDHHLKNYIKELCALPYRYRPPLQ